MKKLLLLLVMVLFCVPAYATMDCTPGSLGAAVLNECVSHPTFVDTDTIFDRDDPLGIGMDLIVYKGDTWYDNQATIETKYDFENDESSIFFVWTMDLDKARRAYFAVE